MMITVMLLHRCRKLCLVFEHLHHWDVLLLICDIDPKLLIDHVHVLIGVLVKLDDVAVLHVGV